jgi:hypothetical protein
MKKAAVYMWYDFVNLSETRKQEAIKGMVIAEILYN